MRRKVFLPLLSLLSLLANFEGEVIIPLRKVGLAVVASLKLVFAAVLLQGLVEGAVPTKGFQVLKRGCSAGHDVC